MKKPELMLPDLPEPTEPYVRPIVDIHRGHGFVSFHRKQDGKWQDLGSLPTAKLEAMFPQFLEELDRDSYFSINSFYRAGYGQPRLAGLEPVYRENKGLRYLNAAFVDMDFHEDAGFDFGYRFGQVITAQDKRIIPPASLIMRSGRGIWLFWLLVQDENPAVPPRAWPDKVLGWQAIQRELVSRMKGDPKSKDPARVTRIPGSLNSRWPEADRVMYWPQLNSRGLGYQYTLASLADFLGVEMPQLRKRSDRIPTPEESARGRSGWRALGERRFEDFERLREMRGAFREGCRNLAALAYAAILRNSGLAEHSVFDAVTRLGRECRPPLSPEEIAGAIRNSHISLRDETVAGWLMVTPEEGKQIPRWANRRALPEVELVDMNMTNTARIELRKQALLEIVRELGWVPPRRQGAALLQQRGICISQAQVGNYYHQMQLTSGAAALLPFSPESVQHSSESSNPPPSSPLPYMRPIVARRRWGAEMNRNG